MITPDKAVAAAARGLGRTASSGRAGTPLLVRGLDTSVRDYFIVPWHEGGGVIALVQVDAASGDTWSQVVLPLPASRLIPTPDDARRAVATQIGQPAAGEPELVWRPCEETASPSQPLYRVAVAGGEVFVAVSGSVHATLTALGSED